MDIKNKERNERYDIYRPGVDGNNVTVIYRTDDRIIQVNGSSVYFAKKEIRKILDDG